MNKIFKIKISVSKKSRGFTLIETLVAISVLSLSILGTFTAVQKGLSSSTFAKDQITAFYLIQEAIEQVRNIRDTNGLESVNSLALGGSGVSWLNGLAELASDPCYFGKTCKIDSSVLVGQATTCTSACPVLNQNTNGQYGYTSGVGWTPTRFTRTVTLQEISPGKEINIIVTVSWTSGAFNKSITVSQSLFNMY